MQHDEKQFVEMEDKYDKNVGLYKADRENSQITQRNLAIQIGVVHAQKTFVLQSLGNMRYLD